MTSRWDDKDDDRGWFDCVTRWEDCPTELVQDMEEIYQQEWTTACMRTDTKLCTKLCVKEVGSLQHIFIRYLELTQTD